MPISFSSVINAVKSLKSDSIDKDGISKMHMPIEFTPLISHFHLHFHFHQILSSLLADNSSKGNGLYICALDLSKVFDSVVHSQLLFSLYNSGVKHSVIILLRFWYSNSFLQSRSAPDTIIRI